MNEVIDVKMKFIQKLIIANCEKIGYNKLIVDVMSFIIFLSMQ